MPSVLKTIKKANEYKIPYGLMETINYTDLKSMVIDYSIEELQKYRNNLEKQRLDELGIERRKATAKDFDNL